MPLMSDVTWPVIRSPFDTSPSSAPAEREPTITTRQTTTSRVAACRLEELTDCALILPNRLAFEHSHSADAIALDVRDARGAEAAERSGAKRRAMCEPFVVHAHAAEPRRLPCELDKKGLEGRSRRRADAVRARRGHHPHVGFYGSDLSGHQGSRRTLGLERGWCPASTGK